MNGTMDVVKFTKNMSTGAVTDIDGVAVEVSKSASTGLQIMSNPLVRLLFQKTINGTTSAYALPTDLHWTATLDTDFDHTSVPVAFTNSGFNGAGTWDASATPDYASGQLTFELNLRTEGALARLGKKAYLAGYLEVCGWTDDTQSADLVFSARIDLRILNVVNPSNVAAVPYDVDTAVTDAIDEAVGDHDASAASHATVPTSVTTAIGTHNSLDTAHGLASVAAVGTHTASAHAITTEGGFSAGTGADAEDGAAVGKGAVAESGFAGGFNAKCLDGEIPIDAIQLGTGTNPTASSVQAYDKVLMNADGTIPLARLALVQPQAATLVGGVATDPTDFTARFIGDMLVGQDASNLAQVWIAVATGTAGWHPIYTASA